MSSSDEEAISAISSEWADAIVANDLATFRRCISDDWVLIDQTGVGNFNDFRTAVTSGLSHSSFKSMEGTERIRVHGDTGVRTARITNTAYYGGEEFLADEWVTDVFVRKEGGWVCALTQVTPVAT